MEYKCPTLYPLDGKPCRHYISPTDQCQPGFCELPSIFRCTESMKHNLPSISYSRLTDFIHCKLRYYHAVVEGLKVKPQHMPEPMKLGTTWDHFIGKVHDNSHENNSNIASLELTAVQSAKVNALLRAYVDLEIQTDTDGLIGSQYKIHIPIGQNQIIGYVDRAYEEHIVETKLSFRPDFYTHRENIAYQIGTYLMGNEAWEYADVQITRIPMLKTGWGKYSDESPEAYEGRIYGDIISRPAHYFIGWDRKTRIYGIRFWRSEFDLDEIFSTYVYVLEELKTTIKHGSWYPNNLACHVPAACPYLPIKRTGVVSDEIFARKGPVQKGGRP